MLQAKRCDVRVVDKVPNRTGLTHHLIENFGVAWRLRKKYEGR